MKVPLSSEGEGLSRFLLCWARYLTLVSIALDLLRLPGPLPGGRDAAAGGGPAGRVKAGLHRAKELAGMGGRLVRFREVGGRLSSPFSGDCLLKRVFLEYVGEEGGLYRD